MFRVHYILKNLKTINLYTYIEKNYTKITLDMIETSPK